VDSSYTPQPGFVSVDGFQDLGVGGSSEPRGEPHPEPPTPQILRPENRNEPRTERSEKTYYLAMLRREAGDLEGYRGFLVHPNTRIYT